MLRLGVTVSARLLYAHVRVHAGHAHGQRRHGSSRAVAGTGVALDIDGVLLRGGRVLSSTTASLRKLHGDNPLRRRFPLVYLTNGGGMTEAQKARQLERVLGVPVAEREVVLSHSPMVELVRRDVRVREGHVLVIGQSPCKEVALSYGMKNPVLVDDIIRWDPSIWPYHSKFDNDAKPSTRPHLNFNAIQFTAIVVIHDSHDWGRDTQICCDLLRSQNGTIGSLSPYHHTPNHRQSVPIFFSNPDFLWSNDFAVPRFGQGGFRKCLERVYEEVTGRELEEVKQFGKPFKETYAFAERRLEELAKSYGGSLCNFSGNVRGTVSGNINGNASAGAGSNDMAVTRKTVFAVGDNIASDITGANHWGWRSILVRTGVFKDGPGNSTTDNTNANPFALRPDHHIPPDFLKLPTFNESLLEPTVLCDDIGEAVEHIIRHESLA